MQKKEEAVETLGFSVIDGDGDQTTPLITTRNVPLLVLTKRYAKGTMNRLTTMAK